VEAYMTILRVHKKQKNFVILDKTCINDEKLSWGAKGLHAFLISMPDDWGVQVSHLQKCSTNGRDAVRGFLSELQKAGYIKRSSKRDNSNGRFGGLEYLVLETPELEFEVYSPDTDNPSSVKNALLLPGTENPATGNPTSGNPTVINNNKNNNKKLNNKTAANNFIKEDGLQQQEKAAAVIFSKSPVTNNLSYRAIDSLTHADVLIGEKLTAYQKQRVSILVNNLNISQKQELVEEIEFCLLNSKHFSACKNDFSRKLNAIRQVILRGDWQKPAGMLSDEAKLNKPDNSIESRLRFELKQAHAELVHFKKLEIAVSEDKRSDFELIIKQVNSKIKNIKDKLEQSGNLKTA
jgi:hypothetical protein